MPNLLLCTVFAGPVAVTLKFGQHTPIELLKWYENIVASERHFLNQLNFEIIYSLPMHRGTLQYCHEDPLPSTKHHGPPLSLSGLRQ